jgi:hypothetical protein
MGKIGNGPFTNLLSFTPCFAQQDGRWGVTIGDAFNKHGNIVIIYSFICQVLFYFYMGTYINYISLPF